MSTEVRILSFVVEGGVVTVPLPGMTVEQVQHYVATYDDRRHQRRSTRLEGL